MAVFDITSGKLTESQGDFHYAAAVVHGTDSINVLASPAFPLGRSFAVLGQNLSFLEVDVNRMAPAVSAILACAPLSVATATATATAATEATKARVGGQGCGRD